MAGPAGRPARYGPPRARLAAATRWRKVPDPSYAALRIGTVIR